MLRKTRKNKKYPPTRAYTPPNIGAILFGLAFTFFSTLVSFQSLAFGLTLIFYWPLTILGLFFNYYLGLGLAKNNYKNIKKKRVKLVCLKMLGIQLTIVAISALIVYSINPNIEVCGVFFCDRGFFAYALYTFFWSTIALTPAYYAIFLYYGWVIVYHIPKPSNTLTNKPKKKKPTSYNDPYL